ncbi:unnamed protein product [Paramecium primaurelia]|uniref:RING-type domain-containing protein n=1 Tax=Paramecium primaurelia TaxID=5886 RepID=A0A8S1NBC2_PARPR|nr:unnamed protein product [Paramecium primaurelia]
MMSVELLVIHQDGESFQNQAQNKSIILSKFDLALREANIICLCICCYYTFKLLFTLVYHKEIEDKSQEYFIIITFLYDVIAFALFAILHALTDNLKFSELSEYDQQINLFELNHCLTCLTIQELFSIYKPLNGCMIIYTLQQKSFSKCLVVLKLLNYLSTYLAINNYNLLFERTNPLIKLQFILLILSWTLQIIISVLLIFIYFIYSIKKKELHFHYKGKIIDKMLLMIKEISYQEKFQNSQQDNLVICSICYQEINENDTIIQLPCHLNHYFHSQCCKQWLMKDLRCPLCRHELDSNNSNKLYSDYL